MTWTSPISLTNFLRAVLAMAAFTFVLRWAGHGNLPGPDPRRWGDPIPFGEALSELPSLFMFSIVEVGVLVLFYGIRSASPQARRGERAVRERAPVAPVRERWAPQLTCPACSAEIGDRMTFARVIFKCHSCGQDVRVAEPSPIIGAVATSRAFASRS